MPYVLETKDGAIWSDERVEFINAAGQQVTFDEYMLGSGDQMALGIWSAESDDLPDPTQKFVTGETFEKRENVYIRHWQTRPLTADEQAVILANRVKALKASYADAVQAVLDQRARERDYDNIQSAVTYAGDDDPAFNAEGTALKKWRSQVWRYSATQLQLVASNQIPQPTVEAFIASLPPFTWPVS